MLSLAYRLEMEIPQSSKEASKISTEFIIENLKSIRDSVINDLLRSDDSLMSFMEKHYNTVAISSVKKEFLRRDLNELKSSTLDLVHYSSLIKEIRESGNLNSWERHPLFQLELKVIFQKYGIEIPQP